ncbi:MAG: YkgJ family cysteine cluster protein [Methanolinea sp.]
MSGENGLPDARALASLIEGMGFECTRCGDCCRAGEGDGNLVMVSPEEICAIAAYSGMDPGEVSEPYPEEIPLPGGRTVTFGRVLRRPRGDCLFFSGGGCTVYPARPAICRTYPFALEGGRLRVYPCRGLGRPIGRGEALRIARALLSRAAAEEEEFSRVREAFSRLPGDPGRYVVDSAGVYPL